MSAAGAAVQNGPGALQNVPGHPHVNATIACPSRGYASLRDGMATIPVLSLEPDFFHGGGRASSNFWIDLTSARTIDVDCDRAHGAELPRKQPPSSYTELAPSVLAVAFICAVSARSFAPSCDSRNSRASISSPILTFALHLPHGTIWSMWLMSGKNTWLW
jgi:hypothetical protein